MSAKDHSQPLGEQKPPLQAHGSLIECFGVAKSAERLDMAILISKGYAVKAIKKLLCKARGEDLQIFVRHDADLDGCTVVRCLEEDPRFDRGTRSRSSTSAWP